MAFSESDLEKMGLEKKPDGSYSKKKTVPQPREAKIIKNGNVNLVNIEASKREADALNMLYLYKTTGQFPNIHIGDKFRYIKLTLFGEPMPKQSVRGFDTGKRNAKGKAIIGHYQPSKMQDRVKDYIKQIKEQLPERFVPFENEVFITKMHFVFSPLKGFHKVKGKMDAIRNGEIFYKNTKPDIDNLSKMALDAIKDQVMVDDNLIVGISEMKKYYGVGGCIIIEMKGW